MGRLRGFVWCCLLGVSVAVAAGGCALFKASDGQMGESAEAARTVERTHTVKPGDTLWRISMEHYGTGSYWRLIVEANDDFDLRAFRPGMKLVIP